MVSLRFPTAAVPHLPPKPAPNGVAIAAMLAAAAAAAASLTLTAKSAGRPVPPRLSLSAPLWASLSLADGAAPVKPCTGELFPTEASAGRRRLGVGFMIRKNLFGLKFIDLCTFGVYADETDLKLKLKKYRNFSFSELKENNELINDVLEHDIRMTVKLQIVYGLSIRSVCSKFESRLKKFGGQCTEDFKSFIAYFNDDYKLPKGSEIELSRESNHVLKISIDGKVVGIIPSKLLCRSILDLYIGDDPFDKIAKYSVHKNIARILEIKNRTWC